MAKFKNNVTGNILNVTNPMTISLMEKSDRYTKVNGGKAAKDDKGNKPADGADGGKSE